MNSWMGAFELMMNFTIMSGQCEGQLDVLLVVACLVYLREMQRQSKI